jgi:hypothetical protein
MRFVTLLRLLRPLGGRGRSSIQGRIQEALSSVSVLVVTLVTDVTLPI